MSQQLTTTDMKSMDKDLTEPVVKRVLLVLDIWMPHPELLDGDIDDLLLASGVKRHGNIEFKVYLVKNPIRYCAVTSQPELVAYFGPHSPFIQGEVDQATLDWADQVWINAPVDNAETRDLMIKDSAAHPGKYFCQGADPGAVNVRGDMWALAETIVPENRFPTTATCVSLGTDIFKVLGIPQEVVDVCLSYTFRKLITPGGVPHLVGRLYCPLVGGGPGVNMLTVHRHLNHVFFANKLDVTAETFDANNEAILEFAAKNRETISVDPRFPFAKEALDVLLEEDEVVNEFAARNPTLPQLKASLRVVRFYANLFYTPHAGGILYKSTTPFFHLGSLPEGTLSPHIAVQILTVMAYDLIMGWSILNGITAGALSQMSHAQIQAAVMAYFEALAN